MVSGKYKTLYESLLRKINAARLLHDPLYTLAWGTDASFYRLIPKLVVLAENEEEISFVLTECSKLSLPVTFRAAGTSLSGQAVTDSVLLVAAGNWNAFKIHDEGRAISMQPGLTGGRANKLLEPYSMKIGPDPASVNAAMIGGIAANNASGMCCGTAQNSYRTVKGMRIVLHDGSVLDTRNSASREAFAATHPTMLDALASLSERTKSDKVLSERIRRKYKMKNTTGYSLNALIDYSDPFDIIEHLMIGSEGTLGFISDITFITVPEFPFRASSLIIFPDIANACLAVPLLKSSPVTAVELIDRAGLRSVENEKGIPAYIRNLPGEACALLVETAAGNSQQLDDNIAAVINSVETINKLFDPHFTSVPDEYEQLWKIRKGLFPSVGAMRRAGTTVIIEDVAFPVESLAAATLDLQSLLKKYGYAEAVIFGHALEGNLHFVFTQDFSSQIEIDRYAGLMDEVANLVVGKYDGALKAEHGTGRNMAPYVELEWGKAAVDLMKEIKSIFDPGNILSPGVILNDDPKIHLKNLKPIPAADEIADKCIECGFCEPSCVSSGLTLSARQRIVVYREMCSLAMSGREPHISAALNRTWQYAGDETCATDGLCATACPVKIDTGKLIKKLRSQRIGSRTAIASWIATHMAFVTSSARILLSAIGKIRLITGAKVFGAIAHGMRKISAGSIPAWNSEMPLGANKIRKTSRKSTDTGIVPEYDTERPKVVYFPSCINRSMGVSHNERHERQLTEVMESLIKKGGFEIIYPSDLDNLCCGMAFSSKGYAAQGKMKSDELEAELLRASENGKHPVVCDMSPCLFTMRENFKSGLRLYEPVEFILEHLIKRLKIIKADEKVLLFPVCSMKKMSLDSRLLELARLCAREAVVAEANCCGFAGDRGFTFPELNRHGLRDLRQYVSPDISGAYSTSRTCEIGLSLHSGISFRSIVYLVDRVSSEAGL